MEPNMDVSKTPPLSAAEVACPASDADASRVVPSTTPQGSVVEVPVGPPSALASISPTRRPAGAHKPRPEPLDLPPISDSSAYVVPEAEQAQQRQQHQHQPPPPPSQGPVCEGSGTNAAAVADRASTANDAEGVPAAVTAQSDGSRLTSTTSNGANARFHTAHRKSVHPALDLWFDYLIGLSEVLFVTKLNLYEDSCAVLLARAAPRKGKKTAESLHRSEKTALDILERMQFHRPVKVRKVSGLIDPIEEEKEFVYEGLEEGYKVFDVDIDAVRHYGSQNGWLPMPAPNEHPPSPPTPDRSGEAQPSTAAATTSPLLPDTASAAATSDDEESEGEAIEHTLLYGELTSAGVRQVTRIFQEAVTSETSNDPYSQEYGTVVVGVDVGCGTGKMLFEWSRLATAQVLLDTAERTPTDACAPSNFPLNMGVGNSEIPTALQYARYGGSCRGGGGQALGGSPAGSLNTRRQQHYVSRMPAELAPPENWSFSSLGASVPASLTVSAPRSNIHGFLGVGIEVAPSRMFVARKAMSPNYLDLLLTKVHRGGFADGRADDTAKRAVPRTRLAGAHEPFAFGDSDSAEEAKKTWRHHTSTATVARSSLPRYDPAPASAVAAPCPDPSKRRPAACVLLHEGDALSPGLLHNQTLFRFPPPSLVASGCGAALRAPASATAAPFESGSFGAALSLGGMAAGLPSGLRATHAPARENYYRLCRVQRAPAPSGHEVPHLSLFCCGIGFDETFVRALCTAIEGLLQPLPPDAPHTTTTATEALASGEARDPQRADMWNGVSSTMNAAAPNSMTAAHKASALFPKLLRPSALAHWKSVTCVLLLRDFDVEETLKQPDFPLFSCCRRWHASTRRTGATEPTTSGERSAASTPAPLFAANATGEGTVLGLPEVLDEYEDRSANVPVWCASRAGLRDSSIRLTHVETTWMTKAPAWVLSFRF